MRRCGWKKIRRGPEEKPEGWEPPPEPPARVRPGAVIGSLRIERHGQVVEIPLLQPGMVNGRDARSDWVALPDGAVMSLRAAAVHAAAQIPPVLSKRQQTDW